MKTAEVKTVQKYQQAGHWRALVTFADGRAVDLASSDRERLDQIQHRAPLALTATNPA